MRVVALFLLLTLIPSMPAGGKGSVVDLLKQLDNEKVSRVDFALFRIGQKVAQLFQSDVYGMLLASEPTYYFTRNDKGGLQLRVLGNVNRDTSKGQPKQDAVEALCNMVIKDIASDVFANYGDPSATNIAGENMYHMAWGSYFSGWSTDDKSREELGRNVSKHADIVVTLDGQVCSAPLDQKFEL